MWQADRERVARMEAGVSGRGAETVYRDKEGRRVEGPEALAAAAEAEKPKHEKPAWGGGIAQARLGTLLQQSSVLHGVGVSNGCIRCLLCSVVADSARAT